MVDGMARTASKLDPEFVQGLERIIGERACGCPRCGYNLSGVPGPRCPECGKNISDYLRVADTTPWRLPGARRRAVLRWLARRIMMVALVFITIVSIVVYLVTLSS